MLLLSVVVVVVWVGQDLGGPFGCIGRELGSRDHNGLGKSSVVSCDYIGDEIIRLTEFRLVGVP